MAHWKDHLNSTLLGAYSLFDDNTEGWKEINGTITRCCKEPHVLGKSGKQTILVGHTTLGKPIKINHKIGLAIQMITGSKNPEKWVNVPVIFYVDPNEKFGNKTVEAIRVKPQIAKKEIDYSKQTEALESSKDLAELQSNFLALTPSEKVALVHIKDEMKIKLTPKG